MSCENNRCVSGDKTTTVSVMKNRYGVDDILFGCGTQKQKRCGVLEDVEAVNASSIPCCTPNGEMSGKNLQDVCDAVHTINPYIGNCDIGARNKLEFRDWNNAKIPLNPVDGQCDMNLPDDMYQRVGFENQDGTCLDGKSWISTMCTLNYNKPDQMAVHKRQWFPFDYLYDMYECMFPQELVCDMNGENCTEFKPLPTLCERVKNIEDNPTANTNNYATALDSAFEGDKVNLTIERNGGMTPLTTNFTRDKVNALTISGNTLKLTQTYGGTKTVTLPTGVANKVNSLSISGGVLSLTQDVGGTKTVALPNLPTEPSMQTAVGSARFSTTYSPEVDIKIKDGTQDYAYVVQSKGIYTINFNLMLRYINADASQHELDYLRLGHTAYIRVNDIAIAFNDIGSSTMGKCKPRMSTSGAVSWTGMLNVGDKVEFYKRTRKCDTAPALDTLSGTMNYAITQIQIRS